MKKLAAIDGARHVIGLLLQRCQWRKWGRLRMERIRALTVLKGTRPSAKLAKQRQSELAHARGRERIVTSLAPYTRSPPCSLTLRPAGLSALGAATTAEAITAAVKACFIHDLCEVLGENESRFELVPCPVDAPDVALGLELQARATPRTLPPP